MRSLALTLAVWLAAAAPTLAQEAEPDVEAQAEAQVEVDASSPSSCATTWPRSARSAPPSRTSADP